MRVLKQALEITDNKTYHLLREILFRGKSGHEDKWVYGAYSSLEVNNHGN